MPVKLNGSTSGYTQLQAAAVAPNNTVNLPTGSGSLMVQSTSSAPTNGQIPIGNGTSYVPATITQGSGITITNGPGTITISSTGGGGGVTSVNGLTGVVQGVILSTTAQTSVGVTSVSFTVPTWAKRATIMFNSVSTGGANNYQVQLGTGGVIKTSGYTGNCSNQTGASTATNSTGFIVNVSSTSNTSLSGIVTIALLGSNVYVQSGVTADAYVSGATRFSAGVVTLTGALDTIRIIASSTGTPADTFDAGSINVQYE